jgi:hypothetical protein
MRPGPTAPRCAPPGITRATPDPEGGKIGRDEDGSPNGLLFETAMELVYNAIPEARPREVVAQAIGQAQHNLWQMGITGVHDYDRAPVSPPCKSCSSRAAAPARGERASRWKTCRMPPPWGCAPALATTSCALARSSCSLTARLARKRPPCCSHMKAKPSNTGILLLDNEQIFEHGPAGGSARLQHGHPRHWRPRQP